MTNISCLYSVEFSEAYIKIFYIIYTFQIISYFLLIILYFFSCLSKVWKLQYEVCKIASFIVAMRRRT